MDTKEKTLDSTAIPLNIPFQDATLRQLYIAVGACTLTIHPGEMEDHTVGDEDKVENWVAGTYHGHIEALPLRISQENGSVRITQRQEWDEILHLFEGRPTLDLILGKAMPYKLAIDTGASETYIDLGGLPLTRLALKQGAGKIMVDFSTPNPVEMDALLVSSGASSIEMMNLANSNVDEIRFDGGAASYKLDFGGTLKHKMDVKISAAMSSVDLVIPPSIPARITYQPMLSGLDLGVGFVEKEDAFWTEAALANLQPLLTIHATLTMGSLNLHSR